MRTKALAAVAAVLTLFVFIAVLLSLSRGSPQEVTIRHVKSVRSGDVTVMTFEITNHTADPYIFHPFEVQLRKGNAWSKFQGFDIARIHPIPTLDPGGVVSYSVTVTNLPAGSVVRFAIRPQKTLLGVNGFVRRAELNLKEPGAGGPNRSLSLNPYDKNSKVFGKPTEVVTDEWIEKEP